MIIPITVSPPLSTGGGSKLPPPFVKVSHEEIMLIELQGSLNVKAAEPGDRNGKLVGYLRMDETGTKPTLEIGHHLLEGKIVQLVKPIAVLSRLKIVDSDKLEEQGEGESTGTDKGEEGGDKGWGISAVVKRKIVFGKRPMPVAQ
ncbi:hypothetical protein AMATHDRAFT_138297 [Amanita thiersii Skay4041]|uniref:Chromosome transmission fidelity protein 8 n=1 Tax=Amanita thiersii Skay4041 TaxID=703135 RepID=A0A2A9NQ92_9AGAR|nr:hypothetical protein AMATHDRAFT_138297 [Amanita thiersii Skay4041]